MANWCNNTVVFKGKPEAIEQIQQLFKTMAVKEQEENCGQLPDFTEDSNGGWFFNIYQDEDITGVFQYETKWSPNIEVVRLIADRYGLEFTQEYEETGNGIFGKATYSQEILDDTALTDKELEQYHYDEETDTYHFEGETFDSDSEILETLLKRKLSFL